MAWIRVVGGRWVYVESSVKDTTLLADMDPDRQDGQKAYGQNRLPRGIRFEPPLQRIHNETIKRPRDAQGKLNAANPNNERTADQICLANMAYALLKYRERSPVEKLFKPIHMNQFKEHTPECSRYGVSSQPTSNSYDSEQNDKSAPYRDRFSHRALVERDDLLDGIISPHTYYARELARKLNEGRHLAALKAICKIGNVQGYLDIQDRYAIKLINDMLIQNSRKDKISMTHLILNLETFIRLVKNAQGYAHYSSQHPTQLEHSSASIPGLSHITTLVDPSMPGDRITFVNPEWALSLREGPIWLGIDRRPDTCQLSVIDDCEFNVIDREPKTDRKFGMTLLVKEPEEQTSDSFEHARSPVSCPRVHPMLRQCVNGALSRIELRTQPYGWIVDRIVENWELVEHYFQGRVSRVGQGTLLLQ